MFLSKIIKFKTDKKQSESKISGCFAFIVDSKGNLVVSYYYNAWGEVFPQYHDYVGYIGSAVVYPEDIHNLNGLFYKGYYYDKETKLYYLITRYYDPEVGRFISADDPKYLDFQVAYGHNRYAYCNNNPVMGYDPMGNDAILVTDYSFLKGVGHAIVYLEDSEGKWIRTEFNPQLNNWWDYVLAGVFLQEATVKNSGFKDFAEVEKELKENGWEYTRIEGDFTDSIDYAKRMEGSGYGKYNLFVKNCEDYVLDVLLRGKVRDYSDGLMIGRLKFGILPSVPSINKIKIQCSDLIVDFMMSIVKAIIQWFQ